MDYNCSDPHCVQSALDSPKSWSDLRQLRLSVTKCCSLFLVGRNNYVDVHQFHIANDSIITFNVFKDLGVIIDCRLTFSSQIFIVVLKATQRIYSISKSFQSRNISLLVLLLKRVFYPFLNIVPRFGV